MYAGKLTTTLHQTTRLVLNFVIGGMGVDSYESGHQAQCLCAKQKYIPTVNTKSASWLQPPLGLAISTQCLLNHWLLLFNWFSSGLTCMRWTKPSIVNSRCFYDTRYARGVKSEITESETEESPVTEAWIADNSCLILSKSIWAAWLTSVGSGSGNGARSVPELTSSNLMMYCDTMYCRRLMELSYNSKITTTSSA